MFLTADILQTCFYDVLVSFSENKSEETDQRQGIQKRCRKLNPWAGPHLEANLIKPPGYNRVWGSDLVCPSLWLSPRFKPYVKKAPAHLVTDFL